MHNNATAKLTRRMAIANGTYVSFCNQPKAHLATSRESKAHFGLPLWVRPWDNRGKCYMDGKRIQCLSNSSQHAPISLFNRLRAIARYWSGISTFFYPLHLTPPLGCSHWNSAKRFGPHKTRIMGLPGSGDSLTIDRAVSTQYLHVTDGQRGRRTVRDGRQLVQPIYSYNAR